MACSLFYTFGLEWAQLCNGHLQKQTCLYRCCSLMCVWGEEEDGMKQQQLMALQRSQSKNSHHSLIEHQRERERERELVCGNTRGWIVPHRSLTLFLPFLENSNVSLSVSLSIARWQTALISWSACVPSRLRDRRSVTTLSVSLRCFYSLFYFSSSVCSSVCVSDSLSCSDWILSYSDLISISTEQCFMRDDTPFVPWVVPFVLLHYLLE